MNDYNFNRKTTGPNIYHVKTEVSDLKNEDFEKAAEEYKARKAQKTQSKPEPKNYWPWIIGGSLMGIGLIIGLVVYFWNRKSKKKI